MMRLIGSALVVMATTAIGFTVARGYRERPVQLRRLSEALRLLRAEIEFTATPLPLALRNVSRRTTEPVRTLFEQASESLSDTDTSVAGALLAGYERIRRKSHLQPADVETLSTFARTLGTSDSVHQSQQFDTTLTQLEGLERDAVDAKHKYERLAQYIGVLGGLFIVILLN